VIETSISSILLLYTSSPPTLLLILSLPIPIDSSLFYYNINQYGSISLEQVVQQQQEQIAALQVLIAQAGLEGEETVVS